MRQVNEECRYTIGEEVNWLLAVGFIMEIKHPKWLANPLLVLKRTIHGGCVSSTRTSIRPAKDPFVLPRIDQIIGATAGSESLCFLDVYSGYNQIKMAIEDQAKTNFITPFGA
jgi:hypothetical protein